MARPKSKDELLSLGMLNYEKLINLVDAMSESEQNAEFPSGTMNRNIRDVLVHLHKWHLMMLDWYKIGSTGHLPEMPAKGYSWKTTPELNKKIWKEGQRTTLDQAKKDLQDSYANVRKLIKCHSDKELFEKKRYKWTDSTSLGAYLISATSSHYDWAFKLIKKATKKPSNC